MLKTRLGTKPTGNIEDIIYTISKHLKNIMNNTSVGNSTLISFDFSFTKYREKECFCTGINYSVNKDTLDIIERDKDV